MARRLARRRRRRAVGAASAGVGAPAGATANQRRTLSIDGDMAKFAYFVRKMRR